MLYLMTVLTFLAAIMFYLLSPRDDSLHLDTYQAEPLIQEFISQHQAAKDYVRRWFGAHIAGEASGADYFNLVDEGYYKLEEFLPMGITHSMCDKNLGENPQYQGCFLSRVVCVNKTNGESIDCNTSPDPNTELYVVTYGGIDSSTPSGRPNWWPNVNASRGRRNERWRRAIAKRTSGSLNCGTLYIDPADPNLDNPDVEHSWCVDNGQVTQAKRFGTGPSTRCVKKVPAGVITALHVPGTDPRAHNEYLYDMFFCMSPVVQGPWHYYPYGLTSYFDGLDNENKHAPASTMDPTHQVGTNKFWYDLVVGVDDPTTPKRGVAGSYDSTVGSEHFEASSFAEFLADKPYFSLANGLSNRLDFNYTPQENDFTISVVAALSVDAALGEDSIQGNLVNLISFEGAEDPITNSVPKVYVEVVGDTGNKSHFRFYVGKFNGMTQQEGYIFKAEGVPLHREQPFTLTMARHGDKIDLYLGGHQTLAERERKLFSGTIQEDRIRDVINKALASKMAIKNPGSHPVHIYAVRYFNRGLDADDVYKLYKEDVHRYGASLTTSYNDPFEGTIYWPSGELADPDER